MQHSRFMRRADVSLQSLYEHNYMLFRLLLPELPANDSWYALRAADRAPVYVHRLSIHPYTSEWLLGHFFPHKRRRFAPEYTIRVYHDARLAEALTEPGTSVAEIRQIKQNRNRALGEWLLYCRRYGYYPDLSAPVVLPEVLL